MEVNCMITSQEERILSNSMPIELSCRSPRSKHHLLVFWSQEEASHLTSTNSVLAIQNQIKMALCSFNDCDVKPDLLVQFWAPTTTMEGRRLLTTLKQPFAFKGPINEDLIRYRKRSLGHTFIVAERDRVGDGDGVIGRVFQNQLPEFCPDVSNYSIKDHPLRDLALSCSITQIWAFPVFKQSQLSQSCVGVLEFLFSSATVDLDPSVFAQELQQAGLFTTLTHQVREQMPKFISHEADEIMESLLQVCETHNLPLACVWIRCGHRTSWSHGGGNSNKTNNDSYVSNMGDLVVSGPELFTYGCPTDMIFPSLLMRVGQGLIGNAFLSDKPYLCRDVTQLSMTQYPIAHMARNLGFTGCFIICLRSIYSGNRDYVLQFYLSLEMARGEHLHNLLSSMVMILKNFLKCFEAVVVDPRDKFFIEVDKFSIDGVFDSLKASPTIINDVEPGALHNEGEVLQANFSDHHLAMKKFANSVGVSVGLDERGEAIVLDNCLGRKSSIVSKEKRLEKKSKAHNQKKSSCSHEILKQQFGKKLEDAAESLGVSPIHS